MLTFDEATHTYTLDGIQLPSVTEVTRFCAYDYKSDRPWLAEAAARRGTAVHEACALIDYGEEPEESRRAVYEHIRALWPKAGEMDIKKLMRFQR